jgi:hypothetical protein
MSATELSQAAPKQTLRGRLTRQLAFARGLRVFAARNNSVQPGIARNSAQQEIDNAR